MRDALAEVIDPDLGVNIVDLGFVRGIALGASFRHGVILLTGSATDTDRAYDLAVQLHSFLQKGRP